MKRKFPALLLTFALTLSLCACGGKDAPANADAQSFDAQAADGQSDAQAADEPSGAQTLKVGLICAGGENDLGETYNFIRGKNDASVMFAAEGVSLEWVIQWNVPENEDCALANRELAREGCRLILNAAPGYEEFMREVASEYPDIRFVCCGGSVSQADDLPNTHNAFANIHEGRYLAGVVAGMKLQEMIDDGEIAPQDAVIGYIGASGSADAVSDYSAYFLGARSVCPGVTMKVRFVGAQADDDAERDAASELAAMGCKLISQQSGSLAPAAVAQDAGILHTGYIHNLTHIAPEASLTSTRIDWYPYFDHAIRAVLNGDELEQDWRHGLDAYAVELTPLNRDLIADGTDETLDEVKASLAGGSLQVFDTSAFAPDIDGIEKLD